MADYLPKFKPGQQITYTASAAVTGGRVVEVTGNRQVGPAGAGSKKVCGVAGFDAKQGEQVTVYDGGVQVLVASAAVAAGDRVAAAANGMVAKATAGQAPVGLALTGGAANQQIEVSFGLRIAEGA